MRINTGCIRGIIMTIKNISLMDVVADATLLERKKKKKKKRKGTRSYKNSKGIRKGTGGLDDGWYSGGAPSGSSGFSGGVGESLISELFAGMQPSGMSGTVNSAVAMNKSYQEPDKDPGMTTYPSENPEAWHEEEPERQVNKVDQARQIFQAMFNQTGMTRADIINAFVTDVGVTDSTGVSYYTRFLDEFGVNTDKEAEDNLGQGTGMGEIEQGGTSSETPETPPIEKPEMEDPADPDRAGIIRTVDNAHLVYKRQSEDGTYHELWIYNLYDTTHDELEIRRDILAGTDIPVNKTFSPDGTQKYAISTMGNAQMIEVSGLPN